jgi:tetratricopeptide (TPR) repeat protein
MNDWFEAEQRVERAQQLYESQRWLEALEEICAAIEINSDNSGWYCNKGYILDQLERYEDAVKAYEHALELDPSDREAMTALGVDLMRTGRYARALDVFEECSHRYPDYEPSYCHRIIAYGEIGQHERAEEMFYLAQQLTDDCPQCYYNIGMSLLDRQLWDRAIWCWRKAIEIDPHYPGARARIAEAARAKGDFQTAKSHYLAELREGPGDVELLADLADLLSEMGETPAAAEKYRQIVELDPENAEAYLALGRIALAQGDPTAALDSLQTAASLDEACPEIHQYLGEAHLRLGRHADARYHLGIALHREPDSRHALMSMGNCLLEAGLPTHAAAYFKRLTELEPQLPGPHHNLGVCCFLRHKFGEGITHCLKALEIQPDYVMAMHKLALAYLHLGRWSDAGRMIRRALTVDPQNVQMQQIARRFRWYRIAKWLRTIFWPIDWMRRSR